MLGVLAFVFGAILILLPVVTFVRLLRLESEIHKLTVRVRQLEGAAPAPPQTPRTASAPVLAPAPAKGDARAPATERTTPSSVRPARDVWAALAAEANALNLEERIGGRWLQHVGMVVLVLGVAFFLRYAFEQGWLSPVIRVALGAFVGVVMVAGGLRLSTRYRAYGLFLCGGGIAILYLSVYASLTLYALLSAPVSFGLFVIISGAAAILADRTGSLPLAVIAVCGGFATPFLVGGDSDQHVVLFTYTGLLIAATAHLARRRAWPWLNVISLLFTIVIVLVWASQFYTADTYLTTELFLTAYCVMFVDVIRRTWRTAGQNAGYVIVLLLAPAGYHVWSIVTLTPHGLAFLVYLIAITLAIVLAGVHYDSSLLRVVGWLAVALPFGAWIELNRSDEWMAATLVALVAVYLVHLAPQVRRMWSAAELDEPDVALLHANAIGLFAALFEVLADVFSATALAMLAVGLAAVNVLLWIALRHRAGAGALHWLGVAMTLVAIAVWIRLRGPWAVATWATEGAVVFWIAMRTSREWLRLGAWALLGMAVYRWLQPDLQATSLPYTPVANARAATGISVTALFYLVAWLQRRQADAAEKYRAGERAVLILSASAITVFVISQEIISFWNVYGESSVASIAREMTLSVSWVMYAALLVIAGFRRNYAPVRYFAIALFGLAILKMFLVDLGTLSGIYRITGFVLVGVMLLIVSYLYQRAGGRALPKPPDA